MRLIVAFVAIAVMWAGAAAVDPTEAAPSQAGVRPGERVGSIRLGMTPRQVQQALGAAPTSRDEDWLIWDRHNIAVLFDGGTAVMIYTADTAVSTAEGIRIGSTDADLIKAFGAPICSSLFTVEGKANLSWVYRGLFAFLAGTPRKVSALAVVANEVGAEVCR